MLNLVELEQLVAFAENGTLLKVSEIMNISQPTLTRNMRHVEDAFGVSLFVHGKNRLELNETGKLAVDYAKRILQDAENAVANVQEFDRKIHSIIVASCAPAPLWSLVPKLAAKYPQNTISSQICGKEEIISDIERGTIDIGILPYAYESENVGCMKYLWEGLSVCVPEKHVLANKEEVTFQELNGYNCLLRDQIGFWTQICYEEMPASRFLIQSDEFEFQELIRSSTLFCFTSNLADLTGDVLKGRKIIPITDEKANVTYHLLYKKKKNWKNNKCLFAE